MMSHASLDACYALRKQQVHEMVKDLYGKAGSPINIADKMFITSMLWGDSMLRGDEKSSTGLDRSLG